MFIDYFYVLFVVVCGVTVCLLRLFYIWIHPTPVFAQGKPKWDGDASNLLSQFSRNYFFLSYFPLNYFCLSNFDSSKLITN